MIASDLISNIYTVYRGKGASKTPVWGSEKSNTALSIANRKIREWASDSNNRWGSLFELRTIGTVDSLTTPTLTYNLPTDFFVPSDFVQIVKANGSITEYPIVQPQKRDQFDQCVYISGNNPKKISFASTIDTSLDGAIIKVGGYYFPAALTLEADNVPVDDPNWLVDIVASELSRNDPAKEDQFPTLVGMANEKYLRMVNANNFSGYLQPNSIPNAMPQLGSSLDSDWAGGGEG